MRSRILTFVGMLALPFASLGCDVDKTQEGEMPEVEMQGGQMPEYDVDAPEVDVDREQRTITTPDIDVSPPQEGTEQATE